MSTVKSNTRTKHVKRPTVSHPKGCDTVEWHSEAPRAAKRRQEPEDEPDGRLSVDLLTAACGSTLKRRRDPKSGRDLVACGRHGSDWSCIEETAALYGVGVGQLMGGPRSSPGLPWRTGQRTRGGDADPLLTGSQVEKFQQALAGHRELAGYLRKKGIEHPESHGFGYGKPLSYRRAGLVMHRSRPHGD